MTGTTASSPPAYIVGQIVQMRYYRASPSMAVIDYFWKLWPIPLNFVGLALPVGLFYNIFALVGLLRGGGLFANANM
jgi:hypothetical protein